MIKQALNNDYIKGDLKVSVKTDSESPIGVFDSGVGGISVLRELVKIMPNEDYLYFGDSINAPYGTKKISRIRELTIKNVEKLMEMGQNPLLLHVTRQRVQQSECLGRCTRICLLSG